MANFRFIIIIGLMYTTNQILIVLYHYIQSRINSEKISIEQKEKYFGIAFLFALVIGLLYFQKKDVVLGLQLGLFLTVFWVLLVLIVKFIIKIPEIFSKTTQRIESINKKGFKITKGNTQKQYFWRDIQQVQFDNELFKLIIKGKSRVVIDKETRNFYMFLKSLPLGYKDCDYTYIDSFFSNLTTCLVCGAIAFNDSKCLSCGCTTWSNELEKDYSNYEEYVIANQLEIFATMEKNEKFNDFKINDRNFEHDSNWAPKVTKKEVLEYSEKEYWNVE